MITFIVGLGILIFGYIFYSAYIEKQFVPDNRDTPASKLYDGVDFLPMRHWQNLFIQLLNIAGLGPILGAIQGILFGPVAFIIIPLGCVFMGGVHDYLSGMISMRNDGAQLTDLINKYLGKNFYKIALIIISAMLLLVTTVFVYTSGDIIAQRFFNQNDFTFSNPIILIIYVVIAAYYILAALFPIDKIIGRFYPVFTAFLLFGTLLVLAGFFTQNIQLQELNFEHLNIHPKGLHILPMFFMTVSCGLLSGFHATQSTIISRTIENEKDGKQVFFGMMCIESLIAMIWAAAAMHVYNSNLVPTNFVGSAHVINSIADVLVSPYFAMIVTIAVVILPITSGDTALRALRMTLGDALKIQQHSILNRLKIIIPVSVFMVIILIWAKSNPDSFSLIWRYFNFGNQLLTIPTFLLATVFLYRNKKNYFVTFIPALFFIFITSSFILNDKTGFNLPYIYSEVTGIILMLISGVLFYKSFLCTKNVEED